MRSLPWLIAVLFLVVAGAGAAWVWQAPDRTDAADADAAPPSRLAQAVTQVAERISAPATEAAPPAEPAPPEKPLSLFSEGSLDGATARLCYFSFNNAREYATTKRLVAHLNAHSPIQIEVVEFVGEKDRIMNTLERAIHSGMRCDGIILSGHHRGKFWGDRSKGTLKAKNLEEMSCSPQHMQWFTSVKALWLEGCNTGRQILTNPNVKPKNKIHGSALNHIRANLDYSRFRRSLSRISDDFDENLNPENLAKDYMRFFPYATVFGWTDKSPGEKAGSHYSFPYHLAQIVRLVDDDPRFLQNPMRGKLSPDSARRYSELLYAMLTRDPFQNRDGRPERLNGDDLYAQAWRDHGNYRYPFAFDNPSIAGYRSLVMHDNQFLRQSKAIRCVLEQPKEIANSPSSTVAYLTRNRALTPIANQLLTAMGQQSSSLLGMLRADEGLREYLELALSADDLPEPQRSDAAALLALLGETEGQTEPAEPAVVTGRLDE